MDAQVPLAAVVVDQADRRVAELRIALELADHELARVTRADDEHFLAARDDPLRGPFHQRSSEQAGAGDERKRQQQVQGSDPTWELHARDRRDQVDGDVGEHAGERDAVRDPPHVAG